MSGSSNVSASWLDWTAWDASALNGWFCFTWMGVDWCWKDGDLKLKSQVLDHASWNGCVTDRGTNIPPAVSPGPDQTVDPPVDAATKFPAEQYNQCPAEMKGLSYDWSAMNTMVDGLFPAGNTNQPIGLVWGWQSLVGGGPLTAPPMDPNYKYQQIIILMSDGLNTQDRWYTNQSNIDSRMYHSIGAAGTCKNAKDAGIIIYTVHVNTDGDPMSTLLQNCASPDSAEPKGPKFFHLTSAGDMVTTFNKIGTALTKLRLAK
jgi:hypothetical protein